MQQEEWLNKQEGPELTSLVFISLSAALGIVLRLIWLLFAVAASS